MFITSGIRDWWARLDLNQQCLKRLIYSQMGLPIFLLTHIINTPYYSKVRAAYLFCSTFHWCTSKESCAMQVSISYHPWSNMFLLSSRCCYEFYSASPFAHTVRTVYSFPTILFQATGGPYRSRTDDLILARDAFSQLN